MSAVEWERPTNPDRFKSEADGLTPLIELALLGLCVIRGQRSTVAISRDRGR